MTILNTIKNFPKEHRVLLTALIISFLCALVPFFLFKPEVGDISRIFEIFYVFIPVAIIAIINITACAMNKDFPLIAKVLSGILNSLIIMVQILGTIFLISLVHSLDEDMKSYDDPAQYQKALTSIVHPQRVAHFPSEIPSFAKDVELHKSQNSWFGSEAIILKFTATQEYIDNELEKNQFISVELPGNYAHEFDGMLTDNSRVSIEGFTFYVLSDHYYENLHGKSFPFHYGIGINHDLNRIIYYYTCPD